MDSIKEQIIKAVFLRLETVSALSPLPRQRLFRSLSSALRHDRFPCAVLQPVTREPVMENALPDLDHRLTVVLRLYGQGNPVDGVLDSLESDCHAAIMAHPRTLGGIARDIIPGTVDYTVEDGDMGETAMSYTILYRTSLSDLNV